MESKTDQAGAASELIDRDLLAAAQEKIDLVNQVAAGLKALGGYNFRKVIPLSDVELRDQVSHGRRRLVLIAVKVAVAEDLLRNASTIWRCWDEYDRRCRAVVDQLMKQAGREEGSCEAAADPG